MTGVLEQGGHWTTAGCPVIQTSINFLKGSGKFNHDIITPAAQAVSGITGAPLTVSRPARVCRFFGRCKKNVITELNVTHQKRIGTPGSLLPCHKTLFNKKYSDSVANIKHHKKPNRDRYYLFESERLGFAVWNEDDLSEAVRLWGDDEVTRYIGGPFSIIKIRERLSLEIENQNRYQIQYWPIFLKINGTFIGCCGLKPYKDDIKILETGFHLCKRYWGKGYASEAAVRVLGYAFDSLMITKIVAGHHPDNIRSKRTLEKLGFRYIRDEYYEPTGLDHPLYEIVKEQFLRS